MNKKIMFFFVAFFAIKATTAQVSFESYSTDLDVIGANYFKGTPGVAGDFPVTNNGATIVLRNDTSAWGDYWSGWAMSRLKDSMSIAYDTNDCAAFPAIGHSGSNVYAVAYQSFTPYYNHIRLANKQIISGLWITNTTITYRSMQNGDGFAKKFGGATGNDPDFYRIIFKGWNNGIAGTDSVVAYLADFTDANNANDYIVKDWKWVDLYALSAVDSITYSLQSSDTVGGLGMNTPAYFCIDDLTYVPATLSTLSPEDGINIYPNPFVSEICLHNTSSCVNAITVMDKNGRRMAYNTILPNEMTRINTTAWASGTYYINMRSKDESKYFQIVK